MPKNRFQKTLKVLKDVKKQIQELSLLKRLDEEIDYIHKHIENLTERDWQIKLSMYTNPSNYCCGEGCNYCDNGWSRNEQYYKIREEYQTYLSKKNK